MTIQQLDPGISEPELSLEPPGSPQESEFRSVLSEDVSPPAWRVWLSRLISLALLPVGAYYLTWRAGTVPGSGVAGVVLFSAEVASFAFIVVTTLVLWRILRGSRAPAPPFGSLDVLIPVAGEPVELVERTLRAALAINYPHETYLLNDGLLAGKDNWREIQKLALRYGVRSFTRTAGDRSKAGNLNHALERTDGEFVAVIDADHCARSSFAQETLGYFIDTDVGWVATPQQFATDRSDILGNKESLFYSFVQCAKAASNAAFSCGNAVVYRRRALRSIGGFSTWNIVEDLHSSYCMHAEGWKSVYHPRPITIGLAPSTGAELVKQRLGWATDSLRLLFWDSPLRKRGLSFMQRIHYLHTGSFYLFAAAQVIFLIAPVLHLLLGTSVMRPDSITDYVVHSAPYLALGFLLVMVHGGFVGGLRGLQKVLFLAPTFALAVIRALVGRKFPSPVTKKSRQGGLSPLLFPQYVLFGLLVTAIVSAVLRPEPGRAVSALWGAWMATALAIPIFTGGVVWVGRLLRMGARWAPSLMALTVAVAALGAPFVAQHNPQSPVVTFAEALGADIGTATGAVGIDGLTIPGIGSDPAVLSAPTDGAYVGVFNDSLLRSATGVEDWSDAHGARVHIAHWYQQWLSGERRPRPDWWEMIAGQGAVPMISWEPWKKPIDGVHSQTQPRVRLRRIARGAFDDYIRKWARAAAEYEDPLLIRTMHEMNGNWYPWSVRTNQNSPDDFVRAWRHIHRIFEDEGAANVGWIWTINSLHGLDEGANIDDLYPGSRYVDWVSFTTFNWGTSSSWSAWSDIDRMIEDTYERLRRFEKPMMISEIGTVHDGGDAAVWMEDTLEKLETSYREIKAVVWFDSDYPGGIDFSLRGPARRTFKQITGDRDHWSPEPVIDEIGGASP